MGMILTNFHPPFSPGEQFDFLGRKAAEVLSDLFPGVQVVIDYKRGRIISSDNEPDPAFKQGSFPEPLRTRYLNVPDDRRWKRQISLLPSEAVSNFLGLQSRDSSVEQKNRPHYVPKCKHVKKTSMSGGHLNEVVAAVAACEHALETWARYVATDLHHEVRMSLSVEFPRWIVSHIIAALHCTSEVSKSDNPMPDLLAKTIVEVQRYLEGLANHRVEGKELSHGVLIARPPKTDKPLRIGAYPDDFQTLKRTALLADGLRAALWISPSGQTVRWLTAASLDNTELPVHCAAEPFGSLGFLAGASASLNGLSLALRKNGSIVIFAKGHPLFIWRSGKWRGLLWDFVKNRINKKYGEIGETMLDAAVILSTTGQSGVLGLVENIPEGLHEKDRVDIARRRIGQPDVHKDVTMAPEGSSSASEKVSQDTYPEWLFHALLHTDKVISLGSSTLAMLASIDGATLINRKGELLAYGAIISSRPRGSEGARSAAALELSNNGFVIKVSADGPIALYEGGREIVEV